MEAYHPSAQKAPLVFPLFCIYERKQDFMLPEEKACSLQYIFQIKLSLTMAGRKVKEKVPKPRTNGNKMEELFEEKENC